MKPSLPLLLCLLLTNYLSSMASETNTITIHNTGMTNVALKMYTVQTSKEGVNYFQAKYITPPLEIPIQENKQYSLTSQIIPTCTKYEFTIPTNDTITRLEIQRMPQHHTS